MKVILVYPILGQFEAALLEHRDGHWIEVVKIQGDNEKDLVNNCAALFRIVTYRVYPPA